GDIELRTFAITRPAAAVHSWEGTAGTTAMEALSIKRIDCRREDAARQLAQLRARLASHAEVISEKGRQLTLAVFGEALPPSRVVERVCEDVRQRGLEALLHYTEKFDGARLDRESLRVSVRELARAHQSADSEFLNSIRRVRQNILAF